MSESTNSLRTVPRSVGPRKKEPNWRGSTQSSALSEFGGNRGDVEYLDVGPSVSGFWNFGGIATLKRMVGTLSTAIGGSSQGTRSSTPPLALSSSTTFAEVKVVPPPVAQVSQSNSSSNNSPKRWKAVAAIVMLGAIVGVALGVTGLGDDNNVVALNGQGLVDATIELQTVDISTRSGSDRFGPFNYQSVQATIQVETSQIQDLFVVVLFDDGSISQQVATLSSRRRVNENAFEVTLTTDEPNGSPFPVRPPQDFYDAWGVFFFRALDECTDADDYKIIYRFFNNGFLEQRESPIPCNP